MCRVNMSRKRHTVLIEITVFRKFHAGGGVGIWLITGVCKFSNPLPVANLDPT